MFLWDTNIVSHFANSHPILALHIQRVAWNEIALPSPTIAELWRGRAEFALKATPEQIIVAHQQLWQTFEIMTKFEVLLLDEKAKEELKRIRKKVKTKKRYPDMMIAAMALAGNHVVVTRNTKHFTDLLPPAQLANWVDTPPH